MGLALDPLPAAVDDREVIEVVLAFNTAPWLSSSWTWLRMKMAPEMNVPGGTRTTPPPDLAQASTAAWMAFVDSVLPSGTAPKLRMSSPPEGPRRPARPPAGRAGAAAGAVSAAGSSLGNNRLAPPANAATKSRRLFPPPDMSPTQPIGGSAR